MKGTSIVSNLVLITAKTWRGFGYSHIFDPGKQVYSYSIAFSTKNRQITVTISKKAKEPMEVIPRQEGT